MSKPCGFLNVLKPVGHTSHDVVEMIRYTSGGEKTGHTGTLDPGASGVLVMMIGVATRLSRYLVEIDKRYRAEFTLGVETDTFDNEGRVISRQSSEGVSAEDIRTALRGLTGDIEMTPPSHSAIRIDGTRAYRLARAGREANLQSRTVSIHTARMLKLCPGPHSRVLVDIHCSKGTYIRSLAQMLGERLGCGAFMSGLVRTAAGEFRIDDAVCLPEIERNGISPYLIAPEHGLGDMPVHTVYGEDLRRAEHGNRIYCDNLEQRAGQRYVILGDQGIVCIAETGRDELGPYLQPRTVLPSGDRRCR